MEKGRTKNLLIASEVGLGASILDRFLDNALHLIPVVGLNPLDLAVEMLLDLPQVQPFLAVGHKRDGDTDAAETAGTTNTVQVGLVIGLLGRRTRLVLLGNVLYGRGVSASNSRPGQGDQCRKTYIVDDQRNGGNIDTTGKNIGGDQNLGLAVSESVDDGITLGSLDTTGQRCNGMALGNHASLNLRSRLASSDEDDGRADSQEAIKLHQGGVLLLVTAAVHVDLFDTLDSQLLVLEGDFVCVWSKLGRIAVDMGGECSREEDDLSGLWEHAAKKSDGQ